MMWRLIRFRRCKRCRGVGYIFAKGQWLPCGRCNWGNWAGLQWVVFRCCMDFWGLRGFTVLGKCLWDFD